jgi:hypothetical protein
VSDDYQWKPITSADILHRHFPKAIEGLKSLEGVIEIEGTTIMFVDLARTLDVLDDDGLPEGD